MTTDQKIKTIVARANTVDIGPFLLATTDGELVTIHFEKLQLSKAMKIATGLFRQVIEMDKENDPKMSEEKKALYGSLVDDFNSLIASYNQKLEKLS